LNVEELRKYSIQVQEMEKKLQLVKLIGWMLDIVIQLQYQTVQV